MGEADQGFFRGEDVADTVDDGCDADGLENVIFREALLANGFLVRVHTDVAIVNGGDGFAPEFEVGVLHAMGAQDVHA